MTGRRRGFTLIELMIVVAILGTPGVGELHPYRQQGQRLDRLLSGGAAQL